MPEKLNTQACARSGAFNQSRDIGHDEAGARTNIHHAKMRI